MSQIILVFLLCTSSNSTTSFEMREPHEHLQDKENETFLLCTFSEPSSSTYPSTRSGFNIWMQNPNFKMFCFQSYVKGMCPYLTPFSILTLHLTVSATIPNLMLSTNLSKVHWSFVSALKESINHILSQLSCFLFILPVVLVFFSFLSSYMF